MVHSAAHPCSPSMCGERQAGERGDPSGRAAYAGAARQRIALAANPPAVFPHGRDACPYDHEGDEGNTDTDDTVIF